MSTWSAFLMPVLPLFTGIRHFPHVLTVLPTKACLLCATPAGMDLYIPGHACRHLPSAVPWISEDRLLIVTVRRCGTPDTWKRHRQQSLSCRILQVAVLNPRHARQVAINDSVSVVILRLWLTNETSKKQQPVSSVWGLILWLCLTHYTSKKQGWNNK